MVVGSLMLYVSFKEEVVIEKTDALKIKDEYAKLNNMINESNQRSYPNVILCEDNLFYKANEEEVIDILNSEGIIYFGDYKDAYSRTLISLVDKISKELNSEKIAYLNIFDIKDEIDLDDLNEPIIKKEGSSGYYKILKILDEYLPNYYLTSETGEKIDTLEKYIIVPTIVFVKNGKVVNIKTGTIDSQKNGYDALTSDEENKIREELTEMFKNNLSNVCENNEIC